MKLQCVQNELQKKFPEWNWQMPKYDQVQWNAIRFDGVHQEGQKVVLLVERIERHHDYEFSATLMTYGFDNQVIQGVKYEKTLPESLDSLRQVCQEEFEKANVLQLFSSKPAASILEELIEDVMHKMAEALRDGYRHRNNIGTVFQIEPTLCRLILARWETQGLVECGNLGAPGMWITLTEKGKKQLINEKGKKQ